MIQDLGYAALTFAILRNTTPETAFWKLLTDAKSTRAQISDEDMEDVMKMRSQGFTLREVAEMYGVTDSNLSHRIEKMRKKIGRA